VGIITTSLALALLSATGNEATASFCVDTVAQVATDYTEVCARCRDGRVFCAGQSSMSMLGLDWKREPPIVWLPGIADATDLSLRIGTVCVLRKGGTLTCTGEHGRSTLVSIPGQGDEVAVTVGNWQVCLLRANGRVACFDTVLLHDRGRDLANGKLKPKEVKGLSDAVQLDVGREHTCALRRDGTLACWGRNGMGQLGFDTEKTNPRTKTVKKHGDCDTCGCEPNPEYYELFFYPDPQPVPGLTNVAQARAGGDTTCARTIAGKVLCWGSNSRGELGDGTLHARPRPGPVTGLDDAVDLDVGDAGACALRRSGQVVCWGIHDISRIGEVNGVRFVPDALTPVQIRGRYQGQRLAVGSEVVFVQVRGGDWLHWGEDFMRIPTERRVFKEPVPLLH
jgi:alpha-tubulin suppressor-like RCC1 family protein